MASVKGPAVICLLLILLSFGDGFHFPDKAQLELSDVLNKECGSTEYEERDRPAEGRLQESPWLALFYYPDESVHFCHGTLITRSYILTTAVCASNIVVNETSVVLGEYDLNTEQDCEGVKCADPVQRRSVEKVIIHEGYNQETFMNDIAMIVLDREVLLSDSIKPICLPLIKFEIGTVNQPNVYNSLWTTLQRPQQYWMRYVELDDCRQLVGHKINLNEGQICARSYNNKTIEMTGGAGSALEVEYHNRMYQVAMLSIGILESEAGTPYIYVDIPKYVKWIHDTVKNN
ncbi:serine protease grass-like isoform X2 [Topomyia yanbarensis]|uniref:serine protease grass-like isoform X2 n=1 Tax=Topomyia yanbarensis TaxID=2498891 RepID=UPI00273BF1E1|nr:serine protease grass-like isoform X2 [Topomyia yanbarensis]